MPGTNSPAPIPESIPSASPEGATESSLGRKPQVNGIRKNRAPKGRHNLARERGLELRAESRGVAPDEAIPPAIVERLREDGFDVAGFEPAPLEAADVVGAVAVVAIGVDSPLLGAPEGPLVERWDDIPPASKAYDASRDAMRRRIEELLSKLSRESGSRP